MYNLPTTVDPNKVFLIQRSELDGRYDPTFYKLKEKVLSNFKFPLEKIGNSFFVKDGDHDKLPANAIADSSNGKRYLRSQDLKGNTIIYENPIFVTDEYFQCVRRCHIYPGDLLFSIMASLGATAIVPESYPICTANRAVGILRQKENAKILPSFVQALLDTNLGFSLLELEKRGAIQQRLNLSDLAMLKLPTPDIEYQKEIVQVYHSGINKKQQKEAEAKALLESIDIYLLGELGISLPEQDNSLEKRIFTTRFSEVGGGRFDSSYYSEINRKITQAINESIYPREEIKKHCEFIAGYAFSSDYYVENSDCILVTIKNIRQNVIDLNNSTFLPSDFYERFSRFKINRNDLLIAMTGATIGKVGIFESDSKALLNQRNGIIKSDRLNTNYLMSLLNTAIYQSIILKNSVGGAQPNISENDITRIKIPIPPLEKQTEIANHIQNIRSQAKALQHEAASALEEAKREVEKMILGE